MESSQPATPHWSGHTFNLSNYHVPSSQDLAEYETELQRLLQLLDWLLNYLEENIPAG